MVGIRRFCFVLVAGCLLASCSGSAGIDNSPPLDYENNPASAKYDFADVDSMIEAFIAENPAVTGATLAVVRRDEGQIYEQAYGEFDRSRVSFIASTGKMLTVVVIMTLADEGLIDMDRPVADYLAWGDHHPGVTMRHLLSMMSGIPAPSSGNNLDHFFEDPCVRDPSLTLQDCARTVFQDETRSIPPMQEFRYSGAAWQVAGAVAEMVTGRTWVELVEQRLVLPCGLRDTGYSNILTNSYPSDFDGDPDALRGPANPSLGGGAYSTVNDYSKVLLMHLHNGLCGQVRLLSEASVQAMQEDLVPDGVAMPLWLPEAINYGMGWWKYQEEEYPEVRGLLIDSGAFGARAYLHRKEGWAAIVILEADTLDGRVLRRSLVPAIKSAVARVAEE